MRIPSSFRGSTRPRSFMTAVAFTVAIMAFGTAPGIGSTASAQPTPILLQHKFQPGETLRHELTQKITDTVSQTANSAPDSKSNATGQPEPPQSSSTSTKTTVTMRMTTKVQSSAPQKSTVVQTIDQLLIEIKGPRLELSYDSADPKNGTAQGNPATANMHKFLSILIGAPFTQDITSTGKIENVRIPAGVIAKLRENAPSQAAGGGVFSEDRIKEMITQASMQVPAVAIAVGQSWKDQVRTAAPPLGTIVTDRVYTFRGPHATYPNFDHVEMKGSMAFEKTANVPGQITLKVDKFDGNYLFDTKVGRVRFSSLTQRFTVANIVEGRSVSESIEQIVTMKLLD